MWSDEEEKKHFQFFFVFVYCRNILFYLFGLISVVTHSPPPAALQKLLHYGQNLDVTGGESTSLLLAWSSVCISDLFQPFLLSLVERSLFKTLSDRMTLGFRTFSWRFYNVGIRRMQKNKRDEDIFEWR